MMTAIRIIMDILILIGCFFAFAGAIGILRMPDVFCRIHASTNIATLGTLGVILGTALWVISNGNIGMGIKILVIGALVLLTYPVSGHAISKAAYKSGIRAAKKMVCDDYGRDDIHE